MAAVPTIDEYVRAFLTSMRAPLKEQTVSTSAGTTRIRKPGERILYGPKGQPIRVIELPEGGNIVEHGDQQHAHVRARPIRVGLATQ